MTLGIELFQAQRYAQQLAARAPALLSQMSLAQAVQVCEANKALKQTMGEVEGQIIAYARAHSPESVIDRCIELYRQIERS